MGSARKDLITWVGDMKYPEDRNVLERIVEDCLDEAIEEATEPLREAINEALRLLVVGAYATTCPACGSKPGTRCYGHGPMPTHEVRRSAARKEARDILSKALRNHEEAR